MKKRIITLVTAFVLMFGICLQPVVAAQIIAQCEQALAAGQPEQFSWEAEAGTIPANTLYFLDRLGDWVKLRLLSFTKDARINTLLDQAQERVGELERLQSQNNLKPAYVNKIVSRYNATLAEIDSRLTSLQVDGTDITDIMSRVVVLTGKNKTIMAGIMAKASAQNYNTIQSAYNQSGNNFCQAVSQWIDRENECNDTVLLIQESSKAFDDVAGEIADVNSTKAAISDSYARVNSYLERVNNIDVSINDSKDELSSAVDKGDLSSTEKENVLSNKLDNFRGDYFYLLNNKPDIDAGLHDLVAYNVKDANNLVARARASSALLDVALDNAAVSSDVAYIENVMSADLNNDKSLDDMLGELQSAKQASIDEELSAVATLVDAQQADVDKLGQSKQTCNDLKDQFQQILNSLKGERMSQARNMVIAMQQDMSSLDSRYLPACGMMSEVQTLYDILVNGNTLNSNSSCSGQSYIDSYVDKLTSWGQGKLALWDIMLQQHDNVIDELESQIGSYDIIVNNKSAKASSVPTDFNEYKQITADDIASSELDNLKSTMASLDSNLNSVSSQLESAEASKTAAYNDLQTVNANLTNKQSSLQSAESDKQAAQAEVQAAQVSLDQATSDLEKVNNNLTAAETAKTASYNNLQAAEAKLDDLSAQKAKLENQIQLLQTAMGPLRIAATSNTTNKELLIQTEVELKTVSDNYNAKQAEVNNLQTKYNADIQTYNDLMAEYDKNNQTLQQTQAALQVVTDAYQTKTAVYDTATSQLATVEADASAKQKEYNAALADYNELAGEKDSIQSDINNQNNLYNNAAVKAVKLEVVKQELDKFVTEKFSNTVSNYQNSVAQLASLDDKWSNISSQYSNVSNGMVNLRTAMNNNNSAQIRNNIDNLKNAAAVVSSSTDYNLPAYKIDSQLNTLASLVDMRGLGQARIDNITASVQASVVNLQNVTCDSAQSIFNQGIIDVCNNFSIGNYINTCQVINNLETQIVNTCQVQPYNNCGNGLVNKGEQCDDDNKLSGDGCSALCQSEIVAYCGDGRIQKPNSFGVNEECENTPPNNYNGDGCSSTCTNETIAVCGDGILQQPNDKNFNEQCDDGNKFAGDGCNNLCQIERGVQKHINIRRTIP